MVSRRNLLLSFAAPLLAAESAPPGKILAAGAHPGDPECGCAGTLARYASLGHEVVILYLNRGEGYCNGFAANRCGAVRSEEARKACNILKARAVFAGQIDGQAIVDNAHYLDFQHIIAAEKPDVVFTQWPIDEHRDHRAISALTLDAWLKSGKTWPLYYYEVAEDTMMFSPSDYVDISSADIETRRHDACYAHASQQPEKWYPRQVELTRFRGTESGHRQAEAFLRHWQSKPVLLP